MVIRINFQHLCRYSALLLSLLPFLVRADWYSYDFDVMGTRASVELWAESSAVAQPSFNLVEAEMRRIELLMSPYIESSELSRINQLKGGEVLSLSDELAYLINKSLYFSRVSRGAFDISFASVGHLYQYRDQVQPDAVEIEKNLSLVDWRNITLNDKNEIVFTQDQMKIDLGGIAKGYAVDQSIQLLISKGLESAIISAGGDSRMIGDRGFVPTPEVAGESEKRIPWMVGIKHPRQADAMALRLPLVNTAISTSGDYERYFFDGEKRVHHIINPRTGRSTSGVVSASVIGAESVNCDVLSTTLFVLGVESGLALIETIAGYDAVMIDADGKVHFSSGLGED